MVQHGGLLLVTRERCIIYQSNTVELALDSSWVKVFGWVLAGKKKAQVTAVVDTNILAG